MSGPVSRNLQTQVLSWVQRYRFSEQLRHVHSRKSVIVKDFAYVEHYTIEELFIVPQYLVYVLGDEREAWVSEDELCPR